MEDTEGAKPNDYDNKVDFLQYTNPIELKKDLAGYSLVKIKAESNFPQENYYSILAMHEGIVVGHLDFEKSTSFDHATFDINEIGSIVRVAGINVPEELKDKLRTANKGLHGFNISKEHRDKGLGKIMWVLGLQTLANENISSVRSISSLQSEIFENLGMKNEESGMVATTKLNDTQKQLLADYMPTTG